MDSSMNAWSIQWTTANFINEYCSKKSFSSCFTFLISHSRYQKPFFSSSAPCWRQKQTKSIKRVSKCEREKKINEEKLITVNCRNLFFFFLFFSVFCVSYSLASTCELKIVLNGNAASEICMNEWVEMIRWMDDDK